MRTFLARVLILLLAMAFAPAVFAQAPEPDAVRLTRYVYTVSWEGANGLLPEQGQLDVMLQNDRTADQQQVVVARTGTDAVLAHLILADGVGFLSQPGKDQQVMQEFLLGPVLVGEYLTIANVLDWAEGRDARTNVNRATLTRSPAGKPTQLSEDGWQVTYASPWVATGTTTEELPTEWTLVRADSGFKMTFKLKEAQGFTPATLPPGYKTINVM